jgi:murein DD-endopeptidase MepM/ murein hydrolase activator NlpD
MRYSLCSFAVWMLLAALAACDAAPARSPVDPIRQPTLPPPTPIPADRFDFPLDPTRFGAYVHGVTGPLDVDTRFGVQNPGLGKAGKCFVDRNGDRAPFDGLYHAGEDWFALDAHGQVAPGLAAAAPVAAVAHGVVSWTQSTGGEGDIVVIEHALRDGTRVWSAYWHLDHAAVARGRIVRRGEIIGRILDRGFNSHLHWEIRTWGDGSNLFPIDSAGGRGDCNGRAPALGYTWDDVASRAAPHAWGYLDPVRFVRDHQE